MVSKKNQQGQILNPLTLPAWRGHIGRYFTRGPSSSSGCRVSFARILGSPLLRLLVLQRTAAAAVVLVIAAAASAPVAAAAAAAAPPLLPLLLLLLPLPVGPGVGPTKEA